MRKNKVFIACDTTNIKKIKEIIKYTKTDKLEIGYKFGLEFLNSKNGRKFISSIKNEIYGMFVSKLDYIKFFIVRTRLA